ncbi:MAG TPA: MYXO-CTERM sorting domain-containing protein [Kofleriaceae bacterium]|jgi:hypothetical protein|nr:MYXO-CTERM sorting domain-containing protein [Kofleriaceae bacterium]
MRFAVLAALAFLALPHPADACVPIDEEITPHEVDPTQANDTTPPPAPEATFSISKRERGGGCLSKTDCDGKYANIYVDVAGTDDATPPERLGYILTIAGGDLPHGIYQRFDDGMPVFQPRGEFTYGFDYEEEDFSFDLEVRTIDLNGNISPPTLLHIDMHEGGGCSTTKQRSEWLLLPVLGFLLRRRRRC